MIERYTASTGLLDLGFGAGGRFTFNFPIGQRPPSQGGGHYAGFVPIDVAYQPTTGKIIVAGHTAGAGTTSQDWAAARLTADGKLDSTFGTGGLVALDSGGIDTGGRIGLVLPSGSTDFEIEFQRIL